MTRVCPRRYTAPSERWQPGERRREVERDLLHPYFRLGFVDDKTGERFLGSLGELFGGDWSPWAKKAEVRRAEAFAQVALASVLLPFSPLALVVLPFLVLSRKTLWKKAVAEAQARHGPAFEAARDAYREAQRRLVGELVAAEAARGGAPRALGAVGVTMATSQEGAAVVASLLGE